MILFTSVTKKTFGKASLIYFGLTIFLIIFTIVYEKFSFGESSFYMRGMFIAPLVAAVISFLSGFNLSWIKTRVSLLLFNSAIAVIVSACLIKGIVEVSGRTTTVDMPYWYVAVGFLAVSLLTGFAKTK